MEFYCLFNQRNKFNRKLIMNDKEYLYCVELASRNHKSLHNLLFKKIRQIQGIKDSEFIFQCICMTLSGLVAGSVDCLIDHKYSDKKIELINDIMKASQKAILFADEKVNINCELKH
jgi:hypothetical protein